MNVYILISHDPRETHSFGVTLGKNLRAGDVVALSGELGAGKTCLVQGIARGLDVPEGYEIVSPAFTLINEYPGRLILYHMDMYRLAGVQDLNDIGFEACFHDRGVVVIEWAEKIKEALPEGVLYISLEYLEENKRKLVLSDSGDRLKGILCAEEGEL